MAKGNGLSPASVAKLPERFKVIVMDQPLKLFLVSFSYSFNLVTLNLFTSIDNIQITVVYPTEEATYVVKYILDIKLFCLPSSSLIFIVLKSSSLVKFEVKFQEVLFRV